MITVEGSRKARHYNRNVAWLTSIGIVLLLTQKSLAQSIQTRNGSTLILEAGGATVTLSNSSTCAAVNSKIIQATNNALVFSLAGATLTFTMPSKCRGRGLVSPSLVYQPDLSTAQYTWTRSLSSAMATIAQQQQTIIALQSAHLSLQSSVSSVTRVDKILMSIPHSRNHKVSSLTYFSIADHIIAPYGIAVGRRSLAW